MCMLDAYTGYTLRLCPSTPNTGWSGLVERYAICPSRPSLAVEPFKKSSNFSRIHILIFFYFCWPRSVANGATIQDSLLVPYYCRMQLNCCINFTNFRCTFIFGTFGAYFYFRDFRCICFIPKFQYTEKTLTHIIQQGTASLYRSFYSPNLAF